MADQWFVDSCGDGVAYVVDIVGTVEGLAGGCLTEVGIGEGEGPGESAGPEGDLRKVGALDNDSLTHG